MTASKEDPDRKPSNGYEFKVNGIQIRTEKRELTANEILLLAKQHGAIPGDPGNYILQGDKGEYSGTDLIDLAEDQVFITIPNTPTDVAC
ncbi:hypothetical protein [Candidatus Palauibacter sp.]|uniref:hypothetical protein n=1 Tax=Candidatus Palauibacter sp. TaxID=3101350 RepID=UPI003B02AA01